VGETSHVIQRTKLNRFLQVGRSAQPQGPVSLYEYSLGNAKQSPGRDRPHKRPGAACKCRAFFQAIPHRRRLEGNTIPVASIGGRHGPLYGQGPPLGCFHCQGSSLLSLLHFSYPSYAMSQTCLPLQTHSPPDCGGSGLPARPLLQSLACRCKLTHLRTVVVVACRLSHFSTSHGLT